MYKNFPGHQQPVFEAIDKKLYESYPVVTEKIIHTADVHLSSRHPERLEAFRKILEICEEEADYLVVSGDLFDANTDLEDLKTDLRPLLSENDFETLIIPGNHDRGAFREDDYLGDSVTVLNGRPFQSFETDDFNIVGVPYRDESFSNLTGELKEACIDGKDNVLMLHCTLRGASGGFGEEEEYMPVRPDELVKTGFDYVLAGHIHSMAVRKKFQDTVFAYPGSPASVSSTETGTRNVWKLDEQLSTVGLESFHYVSRNVEFLPGTEDEVIGSLKSSLSEASSEACALVNVSGFIEGDVEETLDRIRDAVRSEGLEIRLKDGGLESVSSIVGTELYQDFMRRLEDKDAGREDEIKKKFLRALSRHER